MWGCKPVGGAEGSLKRGAQVCGESWKAGGHLAAQQHRISAHNSSPVSHTNWEYCRAKGGEVGGAANLWGGADGSLRKRGAGVHCARELESWGDSFALHLAA